MSPENVDVVPKRFESPDKVRTFPRGRLEVVRIGSLTVGRASCEPCWKRSEHVGLVVSGTAACECEDGKIVELRAGSRVGIPATAHDGWVVDEKPCVSLHFLGAEQYAR